MRKTHSDDQKTLKAEHKTKKQELNTKNTTLQKQNDDLENKIRRLKEEVQHLREQCSTMPDVRAQNNEIARLKQDLQLAHERVSTMRQEIQDVESLKKTNEQTKAQLQRVQSDLEYYKKDVGLRQEHEAKLKELSESLERQRLATATTHGTQPPTDNDSVRIINAVGAVGSGALAASIPVANRQSKVKHVLFSGHFLLLDDDFPY